MSVSHLARSGELPDAPVHAAVPSWRPKRSQGYGDIHAFPLVRNKTSFWTQKSVQRDRIRLRYMVKCARHAVSELRGKITRSLFIHNNNVNSTHCCNLSPQLDKAIVYRCFVHDSDRALAWTWI
jgi:hypothetical protein